MEGPAFASEYLLVCPRCLSLWWVLMIPYEDDPRCPRCGSHFVMGDGSAVVKNYVKGRRVVRLTPERLAEPIRPYRGELRWEFAPVE